MMWGDSDNFHDHHLVWKGPVSPQASFFYNREQILYVERTNQKHTTKHP